MKVKCPTCGKEIDVTRHGKYAPHKNGINRCKSSGQRQENKKNA